MPPTYKAETTLLIERNTPQILDFRAVLADSVGLESYDFYKTQYEMLKSRALAARVIQEQALATDPVFTGVWREAWLSTRLVDAVKGGAMMAKEWLKQRLSSPAPVEDDPLAAEAERIDRYLGMMEIVPTQKTQLVKVVFSTSDRQLSARLANAHAQAYIRYGLERRTQANEEAQIFLEGKLGELKARVNQSEAALNRYRQSKDVISLNEKENVVVERLVDLNKHLTDAEADRIGLESQMQLIRKRRYESLPAVVNNTLIQTLTAQAVRLEGEYANLAAMFKPGYARLDQLRVQAEDTRRRLNDEIQTVVEGIESSYLAAVAREKGLRATMKEQKAAALRFKNAAVEYAILEREVDTNRQLYDNVLQRMKETGVAAELRSSNVLVVDTATPPRRPASPKITQSLALAALLGLMGGVGVIFLREQLDHTLKSLEEAERYLRLPTLGLVPNLLSLDRERHVPQLLPYMTAQMPTAFSATEEKHTTVSPHELPTYIRHGRERRTQANGEAQPWREGKLGGRKARFGPSGAARNWYHQMKNEHLMVMEAYRTLRTAILLSRAEKPPQTLLFTSAMHGEGKTVTTVNTAIVLAQMGARVLLIDADLRRSRCHDLLGVQRRQGMTDILTGRGELHELVQSTSIPELFFLSSGSTPPNPTDLVGSKKMQATLITLSERYDYILLDSPPVMAVSDAVLLSTMAEGVILVINVQATPKPLLREARARLHYARAKMLGTVLNRAELRTGAYAYY
jgi:capsular exopolysaccharide synthesis family protein